MNEILKIAKFFCFYQCDSPPKFHSKTNASAFGVWVCVRVCVRVCVCARVRGGHSFSGWRCNRCNEAESRSLTGPVTWGEADKGPVCVCVCTVILCVNNMCTWTILLVWVCFPLSSLLWTVSHHSKLLTSVNESPHPSLNCAEEPFMSAGVRITLRHARCFGFCMK